MRRPAGPHRRTRGGEGEQGVQRPFRWRIGAQQRLALGLQRARQVERARGRQQLDPVMDHPHRGKGGDHRLGEIGMLQPILALEQLLHHPLPGALALVGDAAAETFGFEPVVERTAEPGVEIGAGQACRLVDRKLAALVEMQGEAAQGGAGHAVGLEIGQLGHPRVMQRAGAFRKGLLPLIAVPAPNARHGPGRPPITRGAARRSETKAGAPVAGPGHAGRNRVSSRFEAASHALCRALRSVKFRWR